MAGLGGGGRGPLEAVRELQLNYKEKEEEEEEEAANECVV